ncbi:MAG: leucyl aminopeptidase, partial [Robiginitomaculum sp.]|nr:leucyl aminopeptidase [Robiginitomaculum sp.]
MKVSFIGPEIGEGQTKAVAVIPVFAKSKLTASAKAYDEILKGQITTSIKAGSIDGMGGKSFQILGPKGIKTNRLYITGCGDKKKFDGEMFGALVCKTLLMSGESTLILHLDGLDLTPVDAARAALGAVLAAYRFDKYRTKLPASKKPSLKSVKIAIENPVKARAAYKNFYGPVADGTCLARDLVMEPANKLFPKSYAARIKKMESLGMKVEILGEKRMKALGMGALLCVGQGSPRESQLVIMKWNGGKKGDKPVCLVGKGVTFDTGGISLKPGAGMWDMKGDMGGSAAVVGAMYAIASRKAKANVIGVVGLVENMPDGDAMRPGDVVRSMKGDTIEIN